MPGAGRESGAAQPNTEQRWEPESEWLGQLRRGGVPTGPDLIQQRACATLAKRQGGPGDDHAVDAGAVAAPGAAHDTARRLLDDEKPHPAVGEEGTLRAHAL